MLRLFDSHAHLDEIPDLEQSIEKAREACVVGILAVGSDPESNERTLEIARKYEDYIHVALGLHPWDLDVNVAKEGLQYLREKVEECIAIGEVGLDYRIRLDKQLQVRVFSEVLKIAREYGKPVIIHARDAWEDAFKLVVKADIEIAVFHWYSGPLHILENILEAGYYISATPAATYQEKHRRALRIAPIERILLESDSPVVYRGLESRPADVVLSARGVADVKGLSVEEVAERTLHNVVKVFGIKL